MSMHILYFHYVFVTRRRMNTIHQASARDLFAYIHATCQNLASNPAKPQYKGLELIRINGTANHIHILIKTGSGFMIQDFPRDIKRSTSLWMGKNKSMFPGWDRWAKKYGCFTVSECMRDTIKHYIMGQQEHHRYKTFDEELRELFGDSAFDPACFDE